MSWLKRGGRRCVGECNPKKKPTFPPAHPTSDLLTSLELRSHVSPSSYRSERTEEKKKNNNNTPRYTTNPVHILGALNHSHSSSHLLLLWRGSEQQASVNRERGLKVCHRERRMNISRPLFFGGRPGAWVPHTPVRTDEHRGWARSRWYTVIRTSSGCGNVK